MACAEQLFAERGLDGVSLREINAVAGYSAAALHYHFETRDGLVRALLSRSQPPMLAARAAAFSRLAALPAPTVTDIVGVLVLPLAVGMEDQPREIARRLRFLARLYFDRSPYMEGVFESSLALFMPYLRRALPALSEETITQRWVFAVGLAQHSLGHIDEIVLPGGRRGRIDPGALRRYLDELCAFIAGGLLSAAPDGATSPASTPK